MTMFTEFNSVASAIYLFGDKKNDHREYNVYLDNDTAQTFNATSGCGGAFGQTCEEQQPTIKYFASNLDDSVHTLKVENLAGVNQSFFGPCFLLYAKPLLKIRRFRLHCAHGAFGVRASRFVGHIVDFREWVHLDFGLIGLRFR